MQRGDSLRERRERQQRFLVEASGLLAASLDVKETLGRVVSLVVPTLADWCSIDLVEAGEIRNVAVLHVDARHHERLQRFRREHPLDPGAPAGAAAVIRTGRSELHPEITAALIEQVRLADAEVELLDVLGAQSAIVVPLSVRGTTFGALTFVSTDPNRRYDEDDLEFAEQIAVRAAVAVDHSQLHDAQKKALAEAGEARAEIARLQAVTEALSEAATRAEVAQVLVREGLVALRAQAGAVLEVRPGRDELDTIEAVGYPDGLPSDGPFAEAVRTKHLVTATSPAELARLWRGAGDWLAAAGDAATLTAPLLVGDDAVGVLHMAYRGPAAFGEHDLTLLATLARQCAQALERARLYEEERSAREQAERLATRLRRLQTVIDATFLGGSLDELIRALLERLRDAVESDTATILILDDTEEALVVRDAIGYEGEVETRVPVGAGFAGKIVASQTPSVVSDISTIDIVSTYLRESTITSLAGVPLVVDGHAIGVLHVGSRTPREFDREDLLLLRLVAGRAAVAIDRVQQHEREHGIAEILQRSLMPERLPEVEGVQSAARYLPGSAGVAVGGDWYDVFELVDGSLGIVVGDVAGHGVPAAAAMGRLRNILRAYALDGAEPGDALTRMNRVACEDGDEVFATVVYVRVSPDRSRLRLASAGHPPPVLRDAHGLIRILEEGRSLPVGAAPDTVYSEFALDVAPGSDLVLFTDGLVERRGESIDEGIERLATVVRTTTASIDGLADEIVAALVGPELSDDLAFVAVRLRPPASTRLSLRFPAEPPALAPMRDRLRAWLQIAGAGAREAFDILVAVNEACSNAVEHPIGRIGPDVGLEAEIVEGNISIVVRDEGCWRPARARDDRGRGIELMEALMERVEFIESPAGTSVRLERRLRGI